MGKQEKTKMGRPKFPPGKARSKAVLLRLTPAMYNKIIKAAKGEGKVATDWLRDRLAQVLEDE